MRSTRGFLIITIAAFAMVIPQASAQVAPIGGMGRPLCRYLLPVDFKADASVGQWLLGYYSGALATSMSVSTAQGFPASIVSDRTRNWSDERLLETARDFCANNPDQPLYRAAGVMVSMVLE